MAGLTFGSQKDTLRLVCDNGVDVTDARVMRRTNEATQELLAELIPVGGMMTADILIGADGFFLLPKEMENAITYSILDSDATVNGQSDVRQGWYNIVNQFAYVDPSQAHDNPLGDWFLVQDPLDPTILRRRYRYPGGTEGSIVRVTGAKRYLPITQDSDYLIIQNVPALKRMIMSIERYENNQTDDGDKLKARAVEMLQAEVRKHLLDPMRALGRKANWEADLVTFQQGSKGWIRARLALELPNAQSMGKEEIGRLLDRTELRLLEMGLFKGCLEEFDATITDGHIYFPSRVETVLAASFCGTPINIRSIYFKYQQNGPGSFDCSCGRRLEDEGEEFFPNSALRRRKYRARVGSPGEKILCVCKLRWAPKEPADQMTITNLEAHRLMGTSILLEQQEKWQEAAAARMEAKEVLDDELREYLSGIQHTVALTTDTFGYNDLGDPL